MLVLLHRVCRLGGPHHHKRVVRQVVRNVAPRRLYVRHHSRLLRLAQVGAVREQPLVRAAQRAPGRAGGVVAGSGRRGQCGLAQQPPLVPATAMSAGVVVSGGLRMQPSIQDEWLVDRQLLPPGGGAWRARKLAAARRRRRRVVWCGKPRAGASEEHGGVGTGACSRPLTS